MPNATMLREIEAQAVVWESCLDPLAASAGKIPRPEGRVLAGGCGDSLFAPMALRSVFLDCGLEVEVASAIEIAGYRRLHAGDTIILSSISGGTQATMAAARAARSAGARVVAITCAAQSPLASLAHHTVILPFQPISRRTPHTLDYLVTLQALWLVAMAWTRVPAADLHGFGRLIGQCVRHCLDHPDVMPGSMQAETRVFWLGAGGDLGTAAYAAAKMHEAGGLPALACETENFIHGQNFMLGPEDRLVLVATSGLSGFRAGDLRGGLARLAGGVLMFDGKPPPNVSAPAGALSPLLLSTIRAQIFTYHLAEHLGLDVELPRAGRAWGASHAEEQSAWMRMPYPE